MTIFTTELFKLDLTHLNIKFSDENQFFEKDLIKQQSFPFRVPRERSFLSFFEFIESHNSTESNRYIKGTLFRNDTYYQAELMVLRISKDIEAVIYYAHDNLTIFNKNLKDLPWPTIEVGDSIFDFAKQTILKDYPETVVNFPRIYAPELYKENDFGQYTGFINQITDGEFIDELPNPFNLPFHNYIMNEIRPFTYLREVLKVIFDEIGYTISGDLITNQSFQKCLLYNENPIFYTNNDFNKLVELDYYNLSFIERVYNYLPSNIRYGLSLHSVVIEFPGTYDVNLNFNGMIYRTDTDSPNFGGNIYIECYFNNELLEEYIITNTNTMTSFFYDVAFNFKLDVPSSLSGRNFEIKIISTGLEDGLMVGKYELNGTKRPLYKNQFSLSDIVPDMLVGDFLSAVKETFVMTSVFDTATKKVYFNFFNSFIENKEAIDLSKYNQTSVPRKLYKSIGYNISFTDGESLFLDKSGNFTEAVSGFEKYLIPIEPLKKVYVNFTQNVKHQDGLSMLFFESNTNANPLFVDGDVSFTRIGFVHNFLRNWLYQKLNSEEYNLTVDLPLFISSKLNSESKIWGYNNYFLVHSLRRLNMNSLFEKITLKLFKLKSIPELELVETVFEKPVIVTSVTTNITGVLPHVTEFSTLVNQSTGTLTHFNFYIYADGSRDPQGLPLSFLWSIISSPSDDDPGTLQKISVDDSSISLTNISYSSIVGIYILRITVSNSEGVISTENLSVTVS